MNENWERETSLFVPSSSLFFFKCNNWEEAVKNPAEKTCAIERAQKAFQKREGSVNSLNLNYFRERQFLLLLFLLLSWTQTDTQAKSWFFGRICWPSLQLLKRKLFFLLCLLLPTVKNNFGWSNLRMKTWKTHREKNHLCCWKDDAFCTLNKARGNSKSLETSQM